MHVQPILFVPLAVCGLWTFGSSLRVLQTTHSANFRHESEKRENFRKTVNRGSVVALLHTKPLIEMVVQSYAHKGWSWA